MLNKTIFLPMLAAALVFALTGCSENGNSGEVASVPTATNSKTSTTLMLMFEESEPGIEPYVTRMLINERFMRLDDGNDAGDFSLLDRTNNTVYNMTHDQQSILVIKKLPVTIESPLKLNLDAKKSIDDKAPPIAGMKSLRYELMVNEKNCASLIVVPGLLPQAIDAMREFQRALAGTHAANLPKTPVDMIDACFLAHNIFAPVRTLQYGFPIHQQDNSGSTRSLLDYNESFKDAPALYELPKTYERTDMGGNKDKKDKKGNEA